MSTRSWKWWGGLLAGLVAVSAGIALTQAEKPLYVKQQGMFFVGGEYVASIDGQIMTGQMYVSYQIPQEVTHRYPIVMIHGAGQTGTNFEMTPDGRAGWRDFFLREGYAVYIVDQPSRARSAYHPDQSGALNRSTTATIEERFTAPERHNTWPQARLHTQWPGTGVAGDPAFDQFFASQVEGVEAVTAERLNRASGIALLDRIGPAILLTHSQAGPYGWQIADARPNLVKGIIAVEPNGPPFYELNFLGAPTWFANGPLARTFGISRLPMSYVPAVTNAADLNPVEQAAPDRADLVRCWRQAEPARKLPNLSRIPIAIVTGEASYRATYDHCTSQYLAQAGVPNEHIRLESRGVHGNGHMMMLEKNNLVIASVIADWLKAHVDKTK
jgi:pimeloyl-ACP methyl ester carboxylesterase